MPIDLEKKRGYILVGFPGSGKSTIAQQIVKKYPETVVLSSDTIRQELFGSDRFDTLGDDIVLNQRLTAHKILYERAVKLILDSKIVVIDATHLDTVKRIASLSFLLTQVPGEILTYVLANTPHAVIAQRMKEKKEMANDNETFFEAWERVFGYFIKRFEQGSITWPTPEEGIEIITADDLKNALR